MANTDFSITKKEWSKTQEKSLKKSSTNLWLPKKHLKCLSILYCRLHILVCTVVFVFLILVNKYYIISDSMSFICRHNLMLKLMLTRFGDLFFIFSAILLQVINRLRVGPSHHSTKKYILHRVATKGLPIFY